MGIEVKGMSSMGATHHEPGIVCYLTDVGDNLGTNKFQRVKSGAVKYTITYEAKLLCTRRGGKSLHGINSMTRARVKRIVSR